MRPTPRALLPVLCIGLAIALTACCCPSGDADEDGEKSAEKDKPSKKKKSSSKTAQAEVGDKLGEVTILWKATKGAEVSLNLSRKYDKKYHLSEKQKADSKGRVEFSLKDLKTGTYTGRLFAKQGKKKFNAKVEFQIDQLAPPQLNSKTEGTPTITVSCSVSGALNGEYGAIKYKNYNIVLNDKGFATFDLKLPKYAKSIKLSDTMEKVSGSGKNIKLRTNLWNGSMGKRSIKEFFEGSGGFASVKLGTQSILGQQSTIEFCRSPGTHVQTVQPL